MLSKRAALSRLEPLKRISELHPSPLHCNARSSWFRPCSFLCSSYLVTTDQSTKAMSTFAPYDQYEVSVPLEQAGDCFAEARTDARHVSRRTQHQRSWNLLANETVSVQVGAAIDAQQLWSGFRTPGLIRFLSNETGYLSQTSDGPRCSTQKHAQRNFVESKHGQRKFLQGLWCANQGMPSLLRIFPEKCPAR